MFVGGCNIVGEDEKWNVGSGAGLYVDATREPWSEHYRMYSYVVSELPAIVETNFPVLPDSSGIFGHRRVCVRVRVRVRVRFASRFSVRTADAETGVANSSSSPNPFSPSPRRVASHLSRFVPMTVAESSSFYEHSTSNSSSAFQLLVLTSSYAGICSCFRQ